MPSNEGTADLAMAHAHKLRYVDPYKRRGRLYLAVARLSTTKAGAWFSINVGWKLDPHLLKLTRGRLGTAGPLATALLESRGARTGQPRRNATLYFHDGDRVTIIASKRGWPKNPAWYYNLREHPDVVFGSLPFRAEVVEDHAERQRLWDLADPAIGSSVSPRMPSRSEGRLIPSLSTAHSSTYALPNGVMATYSGSSAAGSAQANSAAPLAGVEPLVSGFSPSCTLSSTASTASSCAKTTMTAGYEAAAKTTTHALIQFPETYLPKDATVLWSELKLYTAKTSTENKVSVGAYPLTSSWEAGATWNTTNGQTAWKSPGGDFSTGSDATIDPELGNKTGWVDWPMRQAMQEWVNGAVAPTNEGRANYGFLIKDATDGVTNNVFTFETPSEGTNAPQLVTYWIARQGAQSQFTQLPIQLTDKSSLNVNAANGNLMLQNQDLRIAGRGLNFETTRTWNSMDSSLMRVDGFGTTDGNDINLLNWPDGGVSFRSGSGAWFQFHKQGSSFITPARIAAKMCTSGSPAPCPATLPSGTAYRLLYNESQSYIDFSASPPESQTNRPIDYKDRYGNTITVGYREGIEHETFWTDTEGRKIESLDSERTLDGAHVFTAMTDVSGARTLHYEYNESQTEPLLTKYTDANGKQTKYAYDSAHKISEITDPRGNVVKLRFDSEHRIKEIIRTTNSEHTTGPTTTFTYYGVGSAPAPCASTQKATLVKDADWTVAKAHEPIYCANTLARILQQGV